MNLIDKFNQSKSEQNWFQNNYPSKPVSFFAADLKKTLSSPVDYDTDIVKILDVEYIRLKNIEESYVEYMKEKKMIGDISLSKDLSEIIINTPSIFEQSDSPYAIKTKWAVSNEIGCADTSFTYAIHRGYSEYLECEDEEKAKQIKEAIDSIIWEAINLLNPSTVAISLNSIYEYLYKSNRLILDNEKVNSFILNDSITYEGFLSEETSWNYTDNEEETEENPSSLGEMLKKTSAKVDKANQKIELLVTETESNFASLTLNTDSIAASVSKIQEDADKNRMEVEKELAEISSKVNTSMSAEDIKIEIQKELSNGVDKVETSTGFTFNDEGLTVTKSDSEMKTTITEDGMVVYKNDEAVLTADNTGVDAVNLRATTYLIIGTNSRFEDYNEGARTGCFWIGS